MIDTSAVLLSQDVTSMNAITTRLKVPRTKTEFGRRAFSSASPQMWNDIPLPIRYSPSLDIFKRHLETFLP